MKQPLFAPKEVENAWKSLPSEIRETPLVRARRPGLMFKLETLQPTGSYKIRAAFTRLSYTHAPFSPTRRPAHVSKYRYVSSLLGGAAAAGGGSRTSLRCLAGGKVRYFCYGAGTSGGGAPGGSLERTRERIC